MLFLTHNNCCHGSLEVTLAISLSTAPPAVSEPLPVSTPLALAAAAQTALVQPAAAAVALTTATAAPVALAAVAVAETPLAEPAPRHAPTTHAAAATATRRRAGQ